MSGGSYEYLCYAYGLDELLKKRTELERMADRLAGLDEQTFPGVTAAAGATLQLLALIRLWERHTDAQADLLRGVWQAVEWWDSCDSGPDRVREALTELVTPKAVPSDG